MTQQPPFQMRVHSHPPTQPQGFASRREAGLLLGKRLASYSTSDPVVLALPRGGVPVAYEVARALRAPLGVVLVRKLGAPGHSELAVGAIAERGIHVVNEAVVRDLALVPDDLAPILARESTELARRARRFRGKEPRLGIEGRVSILVDDGTATGATARAAIMSARKAGASAVVVALGVASPEAVLALTPEADRVVALLVPERFGAVGAWYDDFRQVSDEEVTTLLSLARRHSESTGHPHSTARPLAKGRGARSGSVSDTDDPPTKNRL